jgi:hypothetical protein
MRRTLALGLLVCVALGAGAGSAAAGSRPLVPVFVQHLIEKRAPRLAYVPARATIPYRYRNFELTGGKLQIWLANRNEPGKLVVFQAQPFHGVCRAGAEKGLQMAGVKTWYGVSGTRRQAWRCVRGTKLTAWTTLPERRYGLFGLARIAASGHRVR